MCKSATLWHTAAVFRSPANRQDPQWQRLPQVGRRRLPAGARSWLLDEQSLTERLIQASGGAFRVQRLSQGWQRPLLSERRLLGIPQGQWALVREVALRCFDQPWVYARSVIPAPTLNGQLRRLRRLQDRSLGALLFQQAALQREEFELALLPPHSPFIHPTLRQESPAWARRSCFRLFGHTLLVSEVFLERFQAR
jgi:chorismate--pyruvate lyase